MRFSPIIAAALGAVLTVGALAVPIAAHAEQASFTNKITGYNTGDFTIPTVDVRYTDTTLTATVHTVNFTGPGFETLVYVHSPNWNPGVSGSALAIGGDSVDGVTPNFEAEQIVGATSTPVTTDGISIKRDAAANTIVISILASKIPFTEPAYVFSGFSDNGDDIAYAGESYGGTPPVAGLGPVKKGAAVTATAVTLTSPTQVHASTPASVVATVSPAVAGSVQLLDGATVIATVPAVSGFAVITIPSGLASGAHVFAARFLPADPEIFAASTSAPFPFTVISAAKSTTTKLVLSKSTQKFKKTSSKATVTVSGKPSGTVAIYDGKKKLKTVTLKKGKATYTLSKSLKKGKHKIKAVFTPTDVEAFAPSTSKTVTLTVKK